MKTHILVAIASSCSLFVSCNGTPTNNNTANKDSVKITPLGPITIASVSPSPEFPDAKLGISTVKGEKSGADSAKITFNFDVKNYELKMQTSDNGSKMCNNSDKGQHIHFIMDDQPYKALYEPNNNITLRNGTEHNLIAFLSRSYHESIKTKAAAVVCHFKIDEKGNLKKLEDPKTPMLFYSRPKGDYIGKDTANILLDFYVWNVTLSPDGYKVKADISNIDRPGRDTTIIVDKWEPHFIQNLGTGKCKVTLTLVDKDGKQVEGSQTSTSRNFNLMATEPAKK